MSTGTGQGSLRLDLDIARPGRADSVPARRFLGGTVAGRLVEASRTYPLGAAAVFVLVVILITIALGPVLPLADPQQPALVDRLRPPLATGGNGTFHWLGTDQLGRDVLSRSIYGGRISLGLAVATVIVSGTIGTILGLVAGYRRGAVDYVIMRLVDFQMAVPSLLLAIFLMYLIGASLTNLVVLLSILNWYSYTRIVRSETLSVSRSGYVDAAIVCGANDSRILFRHILPQVKPVLVVIAAFDFSAVILAEAGISFLGFGVQPPQTSWGRMISEGQQFVTTGNWWLFAAPGLAIFVTVLCVRLGSPWIEHMVGAKRTGSMNGVEKP